MTILLELSGQISVSEQAQIDQAAGKLWSALGSNLSRKLGCTTSHVPDNLGSRTDLTEIHLRRFLSYFLNYNVEALDLSQIRYRYPHYNEAAIQEDLDYFTDRGLVVRSANGWTLSTQGAAIVEAFWDFKVEEAVACEERTPHLNVLTTTARKIIQAYHERQGLPSLHLRISNRPSGFEAYPKLLQAFIFQQELSAVFNDIGHHRFDNLLSTGAEEWTEWELSPLAQELMGATRNHRIYAVERCYNQAFWRVAPRACDGAIQELLDLGLVELRADSIYQTSLGNRFFNAADEQAEERIYGAWNQLSHEEYGVFKKSLEWLNE